MRIVCQFDGEALWPVGGSRQELQATYKKGDRLALEPWEEKSRKSEQHFHASVRSAWKNLRGEAAGRYKTPKQLRTWAMVKAGWCTESSHVMGTEEQAIWAAMTIRAIDEDSDYLIVQQKGKVVRVYRAMSTKKMNREDFQNMKTEVLDILSGAIGVSRAALEAEGKLGGD